MKGQTGQRFTSVFRGREGRQVGVKEIGQRYSDLNDILQSRWRALDVDGKKQQQKRLVKLLDYIYYRQAREVLGASYPQIPHYVRVF